VELARKRGFVRLAGGSGQHAARRAKRRLVRLERRKLFKKLLSRWAEQKRGEQGPVPRAHHIHGVDRRVAAALRTRAKPCHGKLFGHQHQPLSDPKTRRAGGQHRP